MGISDLGNELYIDKIKLPTGNEYTIVDMGARTAIDNMSKFTSFLGVTTTEITDGTTSAVVSIGGSNVTATVGSIVIKTTGSTTAGRIAQEYIYTDNGWQLFGDISATNLGNLAYKSSATTKYRPAGSINTTTATLTSSGKFQPAGTISITTGTLTSSGKFQPGGTIKLTTSSVTAKITTTSTKPTGSATASFWWHKPAGSVTSTTSRTLSTASVVSSVSGNTLVSGISTADPATATPTGGLNYTTVNDHTLQLKYIVQSTKNALSSTATKTVVTGVSVSNTSAFIGTEIYVKHPSVVVPTAAEFTGTTGTITVTGTAVTGASFTGTTGTITVTGTVINGASFAGTTATITVS